jgi:aurora kinase
MKICDFGWSIATPLMRETFCGTPLYVSPELLKRNCYNNKIDIWSLGILSYEILLGQVPFEICCEADYVKIVVYVLYS